MFERFPNIVLQIASICIYGLHVSSVCRNIQLESILTFYGLVFASFLGMTLIVTQSEIIFKKLLRLLIHW